MAESPELPHLLFYGPSGAGKRCRVVALLKEIFGSGVEHIRLEHRTFKTPTNREIEIATLGSNYHIECNPSEAGNNDRFVIQEVIKEIASHANLSQNAFQKSNNSSSDIGPNRSFKVVVLTEVDRLSKQAQAGLRRTMEKYSSQCRIILVCNSPSKIIEPVRSRCLGIRIPAPTVEEISGILTDICRKESISSQNGLSVAEVTSKIALNCNRNLRRALLMLETHRVQSQMPLPNSVGASSLPLPDWEIYISRVAKEILQEQSPAKLIQVREMLYNLLTNCIPVEMIFIGLMNELMKALDDELKHELVYWSAYYEHRIRLGSKEIFHLEAFVAKFMAFYKRWLISLFG